MFTGASNIPCICGTNKDTIFSYNNNYDMIILTPKYFSDDLQLLTEYKERYGIATKLVTLNDIYDGTYFEVQGRDKQEKIKFFIKSAIEEWDIQYVLLVGGKKGQLNSWHLPVRYICIDDSYDSCHISDLYYADIYDSDGNFSSWDSDGDGLYGEWYYGEVAEDNGIDLYPDVYVGRLACRNRLEVMTMVRKIITYETMTYAKEWFKTIVVAAGDTLLECENANWTGYEGEETTQRVLENMSGFKHVALWTSDGTLTGPWDVIHAVNNGCGFLYFEGHAMPYGWFTHPPNNRTVIHGISTISMMFLRNKDMYPVCIAGGCHSLQFDVNIRTLLEKPWFQVIFECWGWKLTRKIGGGSIATIGNTGVGYLSEDKQSLDGAGDYLRPRFFYEYNVNGVDILGETWGKAITNYLNNYPINWSTPGGWDCTIDAKTVQQWVLLGDPSLKIGGYS